MTYEEYKAIIAKSNAADWIYDDEYQSYLYKQDISITLKARLEEEKEIYEKWSEIFPDEKAYKHVIEFYYNGARIDDFLTVSVNSHRMCIPYPKVGKLTITTEQYNIGRIINIPYYDVIDRYDEYLRTAGITVK